MRTVLLGLVLLGFGLSTHAQAAGPKKRVIRAALKTTAPLKAGQYRVSHYLGPVAPKLFGYLGVHIVTGSDCGDNDSVPNPCTWVTPFLVTADAAGKLLSTTAIPTRKDAHSQFGWGIAKLKDYDGDGREELAVIFGYVHHPVTVYEEEHHREIAWFDFKSPQKPRRQGGLLLGFHMGDPAVVPYLKTTFRYGKDRSLKLRIRETITGQLRTTARTLLYDPKTDLWPRATAQPMP